jgi:hypothetical protein
MHGKRIQLSKSAIIKQIPEKKNYCSFCIVEQREGEGKGEAKDL